METYKTIAKLFEPKVGNPRLMKFAYTLGAQLHLFPYKFYYKNNWMFRWYPYGVLGTLPLYYYINTLVNTPENKAKWKEIRRKELAETHYWDDEH